MLPESFDEALVDAVKACGGSKVVGVALWPAKGVEVAQRSLLNALNPERNEKLSSEEIVHVARMARDRGCHVVMEYMAHSLGYSMPVPIAPKDEFAELLRKHNELLRETKVQSENLQAMLSKPTLMRVA